LTAVDPERWQQVDRLFEAVLERAAAERAVFLAGACAMDPELKTEVESLLAAHDDQDSFLERAPGAAHRTTHSGNDVNEFIGRALGGYRILSTLGRGGVGVVYLAEDSRLSRRVAVKLLARSAPDQDTVRRFRKEALAASALNHPNILTIHEIGEWRGRDFIVTEFVDGMTLREYIRRERPPLHVAVDVALQVASALAAAHGVGIVHRDIKPENIMVRPDGLVKVLDFGIAKQAGPRATGSDIHTASGFLLGTAAYMSPEQARGVPVDGRSDIWSLGVVLYEMVSGRLPFPGETPGDRLASILERTPEPIRQLHPAVPAGLEKLIERALAKNREARYIDAARLINDLRNAREELALTRRFGWLHMRKRPLLCATVLLILICAATPAIHYIGAGIGTQRERPAVPAPDTIHSLAVLPFVNDGAAGEADFVAYGITDTLIDDLSQINDLKVISHSAVLRYKGVSVDTQAAARALQVRALLTGRVAQRGQNLWVTVELVDAVDKSHLWGEHYEHNLTNLVELPTQMASAITEKLRLRLSREERDRLARHHTHSPEAYQAYLRGRYYWLRRAFPSSLQGSAPDFGKSRDFFQQAIEADPGYALAYCGLGHYYAMAAGNGLMRPQDGWPKARSAFQKAMELDASLPDIRSGLAVIQWMDHRDWAGAEKELRSLLRANPSSRPEALYARLLAAEGRFEEAIAQARGLSRSIPFPSVSVLRWATFIIRPAGTARRSGSTARRSSLIRAMCGCMKRWAMRMSTRAISAKRSPNGATR
jgi:TolB-like protein